MLLPPSSHIFVGLQMATPGHRHRTRFSAPTGESISADQRGEEDAPPLRTHSAELMTTHTGRAEDCDPCPFYEQRNACKRRAERIVEAKDAAP